MNRILVIILELAVEHYFHTGIYRERKRKEEKLVTTIGCSLSLVWISQVT